MTPAKAARLFKKGLLSKVDLDAFLYNQSLNGIEIAWEKIDPVTYHKYDEMIENVELNKKEIKMIKNVYWEGGKLSAEFCATFIKDPRCVAVATGLETIDNIAESD